MSKRINDAIDIAMDALGNLKDAIDDDTSVTLKLELTKQEAEILHGIMRMDIMIPREINQRVPYPTLRAVENVMEKLRNALLR
jgi:hypothetical protein